MNQHPKIVQKEEQENIKSLIKLEMLIFYILPPKLIKTL